MRSELTIERKASFQYFSLGFLFPFVDVFSLELSLLILAILLYLFYVRDHLQHLNYTKLDIRQW